MAKRILTKMLVFYLLNVVFVLIAAFPFGLITGTSIQKTFDNLTEPITKGDFGAVLVFLLVILALTIFVSFTWWLTVYLIR